MVHLHGKWNLFVSCYDQDISWAFYFSRNSKAILGFVEKCILGTVTKRFFVKCHHVLASLACTAELAAQIIWQGRLRTNAFLTAEEKYACLVKHAWIYRFELYFTETIFAQDRLQMDPGLCCIGRSDHTKRSEVKIGYTCTNRRQASNN